MDIKNGDMFKKSLDGVDFVVKKVVNDMAVLESQDGKRQILTEVNTLKLKSFYLNEIDYINLNTITHNQLPPLLD